MDDHDDLPQTPQARAELTRRGLLRAGVGGGAGVAAALALPAATAASAAPAPAARASATAPARLLRFTEGTNAAVTASPAGDRLVTEVQGVLWALPRRGGTATALTTPALEPTRPAYSPRGDMIAVCGYQDGGFHLWVMAPDGSELRQLTSGPWDDRGVAWSPDGHRIAFSSERGGDPVTGSPYRIWTVDVRSGKLTRLTGEPASAGLEDYDPAWHPDGERVLFVRADAKGARTLASVAADGSGSSGDARVERTVDSGTLLCPAISRDGRVAYVRLDGPPPPAGAESAVLMVDGEAVSDGEAVAPMPPCWTRDGELLYTADGQLRARRPDRPGKAETIPFSAELRVPAPARRRRRDSPVFGDSTASRPVRGIHLPALSPDGSSVAFAALNALWVQRIGGKPRKLFQADPSAYVQMPAWAPDGRSLVFSCEGPAQGPAGEPAQGPVLGRGRNGLISVRRLRLDTGAEEVLAEGGRLNPALSPDGSRLACQDSVGNLLVKDLASGEERQLVTPLGANGLPGRPSWSPDGRRIAFCDRNRLNQRFREGYNVIRVVDAATGASAAYLPGPHASLSDRGDCGPVWSPDGTAMAFVTESALWILPVHTDGSPAGAMRRLTDEPADHPSFSGDGQKLLYESSGRLRLIGRDGSGRRTVAVPLSYRRRVPARGDVVRVHAGRLWDGTGERVRDDVDIVVSGHRISSLEPHRGAGPRRGEKYVDASDRTVLPGLWDAHTHPWQYTYGGRQGGLMLAYGVTTNVSLGGFAHEAVRIRESVAARRMAGPRLFATGELIDGDRVAYSMGRAHRTRDGVRRTLERAVALDHDFVKTYVRAPGWIMSEAARTAHDRLGVPSGSHLLSPGVNVGQDLTSHLQATQRSEYGRAMAPTGQSYQDVLETYRGGDFAIVVTPFSALALIGADPALARDPRVTTLMPPWDAAEVASLAGAAPTADQIRAIEQESATYRRIVAEGGRLAMGTDAPLTPVGLHLHLGLRALHRYGGLTVAQTLRTATSVPAELFGAGDDLGAVTEGRIADLVAVDGDPFSDFEALVRTDWAMRDGILFRSAELVDAYAAPPARPVATARAAESAAGAVDWLAVSRQLRSEPCCAAHLPV
jgi:Tol biopolymer transport system component